MCLPLQAVAQTSIYPCHFNLSEVELLPGIFRTAADRNVATLMAYDVDRLLTPFVRQAGLEDGRYAGWLSQHPSFRNWGEKDWSLEGHVAGHYLTALSLAWASTPDGALRRNLGERIDYMLSVLDDCQRVFDSSTDGMKGFLGGQPVNQIWTGLYAGDLEEFNKYGGWVPLYCEHKMLAGLRDVWLYTGNEKARGLFHKMADWAVELIANIDDAQMQRLLDWEHGGMNETLADAYRIFGDRRYLDAACRYSHRRMLDGMQHDDPAFLNGMHANTQVPKYIGFERISQELRASGSDDRYGVAARNFWNDVTARRTVCIGGNSVSEHFLAKDVCGRYMTNLEGPETCNSNNMLKLSEMLFDDSHDARYADFYENVLYNHILSTQDPVTGGYVYFTSLRPQSYRIYSQVNQGMWCCVGTGMENHCKYGHFIYSRSADDKILYVNLFIPSKLESGRFALTQTTDFPYVGRTKLTIGKSGNYTLALRHPAWAQNGFAVTVNGKALHAAVEPGKASYVEINRRWKSGDVVEVTLPMALRYEECPNLPDYIAFKYGPVLLAAQTTAVSPAEAAVTGLVYESLPNEYGGEGRMDHSPGSMATAKDLSSAPMLLCDRADVLNRVAAHDSVPLEFTLDVAVPRGVSSWSKLVLKPFYSIHHARYSCYFYQQTEDMYVASGMAAADRAARELVRRTLDFVAAGEQQSEAGHGMKRSDESRSGTYRNESYRDAAAGGYVEYVLATGDVSDSRLSLMFRFSTKDAGRRASLIVDGERLSEIEISAGNAGTDESGFYNEEITLPASVLTESDGSLRREITVRLVADASTPLPRLFHLRLLRP